ncbi:WD40 repeat-like protein [Suillus plorans]|uniref:WD40 repeat-like protein n=1 Tax=Suillus plorans TaxID=116603 RepID=A0A9P7E3P2_9AGAM|nr:WD40 repeat-like protein [Suillus plorans]KAG1810129.1 WD40 repeat-like protein [Suillus plorans]
MSRPLAVHRCRFVDYAPSPITALAFPPLPLPSLKGKKRERDLKDNKFGTLGVGHANGNIDLLEWTAEEGEIQAPQAWQVRKTLPGPCPSKVDSLAFTLRYPDIFPSEAIPSCSDLRLFSSGGGSELLEWNISHSCVRRTISSQGGAIWSIAANPASTLLALGCEDGSVRLLSLAADTLQHHRRFDRIKSRILSIAWGPPAPRPPKQRTAKKTNSGMDSDEDSDDDEDEWTDTWLVTGGSDSSLRKWDVATGRSTDRMGTDKMKGERTLVWTVGVLADGTIVSGDSLGTVKFWDSMTCTQTCSYLAHGADVLCLAIGPEGTSVFSSGVDQKIVLFSYVPTAPENSSSVLSSSPARWIQSGSRRVHSHDVRCLAVWPPHSPIPPTYKRKPTANATYIAPVLASGGLDMSIALTPALPASTTSSSIAPRVVNPLTTRVTTTFEDSYYRRIAYTAAMCVSRGARLVASIHETGVNIWRVLCIPDSDVIVDGVDPSTDPETRTSWEKVLEMDLNVRTNLIASALSDDGRWLVVSDLYEAKLFQLSFNPAGVLKSSRVRTFASILENRITAQSSQNPVSTGGSSFTFTPDSSKLIMASAITSLILVIDLSSEAPTILRTFNQHCNAGSITSGRVVRGINRGTSDEDEQSVGGIDSVAIMKIAVSPDGQWLATSDDLCRIFIFNLDSIQYHTTLPSLPLPPSVLVFLPDNPQILLAVLPNNTIHIFHVEHGEVPTWGREFNSRLPKQFLSAPDPVIGVAFEPLPLSDGEMTGIAPPSTKPKEAIFWGSSWLCKLELDWEGKYTGQSRKRRRQTGPVAVGEMASERKLRMVTNYRPILALDFLGPGELVLVERPLADVLSKLPPAFFKPKYGQT